MKNSEGVAIGVVSGIYVKVKTFGLILSEITLAATLDTAYYAVVGAIFGGAVSLLWGIVKAKIKKYVEKD